MNINHQLSRNISLRDFLLRCCQLIIASRTRLSPDHNHQLTAECQKIDAIITRHIASPHRQHNTAYLEVNLLLPGLLEAVTVEQWSFNFTSNLEGSVILLDDSSDEQNSDPSEFTKTNTGKLSLGELARMLQNIEPSSLMNSRKCSKTLFNFTFDRQSCSSIDGETTFETPIEYLQLKQFNCSINLIYDYQIEDEVLPESLPTHKNSHYALIRSPEKTHDKNCTMSNNHEHNRHSCDIIKMSPQIPHNRQHQFAKEAAEQSDNITIRREQPPVHNTRKFSEAVPYSVSSKSIADNRQCVIDKGTLQGLKKEFSRLKFSEMKSPSLKDILGSLMPDSLV